MYKNAGFDFNREQTPPLICHDEFEIHSQEAEIRADGCQVSNELLFSLILTKVSAENNINHQYSEMKLKYYRLRLFQITLLNLYRN